MIAIPTNLTVELLLEEAKKYCDAKTVDWIQLAYEFADSAHAGQKRKSGELYISHPLATAYILATMRIDPNIVVASLMHDIPEDTAVTLADIEKNFSKDIASMIAGITKLGTLKYRGVERYLENLRKMFVAMAEDVRVMIIKFADRIHNLTTLDSLPPNKRHRIAWESLEIYAPIANRLGMGEFKGMLEDLSFPYIYPKEFEKVKAIRADTLSNAAEALKKTSVRISEELKKAGVKVVSLHSREKQLYSLYQKLLKRDWETTKIYDIIALRIVVQDVGDCYAALGIIHQIWRPLKGRIKDYIAQPKPNGYQSLHTTIFGEDGKVMEFQIRTKEMHDEAEYGVAAHWHYDENGVRLPNKNIAWAQELAKLQKETLANLSDLEEMKIDFFHNHIFVFTPKGDVIDLPEDATPVDFAYHIHSDIGHHCSGAKINDQLVSLDTPLKSGDVVEVITSKDRKGPSPDWMKTVKTHAAKMHIKNKLNKTKLQWLKSILPKKK
ncbi:MAG: RelA/SpoT family protein [Candidatus Magasanikbacteria bacterium]